MGEGGGSDISMWEAMERAGSHYNSGAVGNGLKQAERLSMLQGYQPHTYRGIYCRYGFLVLCA